MRASRVVATRRRAGLPRPAGRRCAGRVGRLVIVDGPAGIGTSSLLTAAAETAEAAGIRTLRASGSPLEQDAGWGVARQLFAPVRDAEWDRFAVGAAALARRALDADEAEPVRGGDVMHAAMHGLTWLAADGADPPHPRLRQARRHRPDGPRGEPALSRSPRT